MINLSLYYSETVWSLKVRFSLEKSRTEMFLFLSDLSLKCQRHIGYSIFIGNLVYDEDSRGCTVNLHTYRDEEMTIRNYLEQHNEVSSYIFEPKIAPIQSKLINMIDAIAIICIIVYLYELYIY